MNYHNITTEDMKNGPGLRVVLWVSGCCNNCRGCHNPITHDFKSGLPFDLTTRDELIDKLDHDYIQGITFSGGDPLDPKNVESVVDIIEYIRALFGYSKDIWIYSGYTFEELVSRNDLWTDRALRLSDVLVDGKYIPELRDTVLPYRGSRNQRLINLRLSNSNHIETFEIKR